MANTGNPSNKSRPDGQARLLEAFRRHQAGDLQAAAQGYERILKTQPRNDNVLNLLGAIHHKTGKHTRALALIRKAIAINDREPFYYNNLGATLLALGQVDEAAASLRRAHALDPENAEALNNLGNALVRLKKPEEAETCYRQALALRPGYAVAHNNLGSALRVLGRPEEACASYRSALEAKPRYASALSNLGRVRHEMGYYDEALDLYDRALAIDPAAADAHANRAIVLLQMGRFEEGWDEYEWRWRTSGFATLRRDFRQPPWDGGDLGGRTILLHAEQGLGSAIQFVRYASMVAACGGRVVLECKKPLFRLFSSLRTGSDAPVSHLVIKGEKIPTFDVHAPLMSLPRLLKTRLDTIPAPIPYLSADDTIVEKWRDRLARRGRRKIGLVWAGNPQHENDRNRSMPASALIPLVQRDGDSFFSLQVGPQAAELAALPAGAVVDLAPDLDDFADTAALIANLDLVIAVDTAVAHLAGAMGRPVWLLVPHVAEWRWLRNREDTPWYPIMTLFRQTAPGDWDGVIRRVRDRLDLLVPSPAAGEAP